jgi:glutamyl-Q tRNA(Asp) synthetase
MTQPVFRFAPSPNGKLHLGHAYSALLNEKLAYEHKGRLLLRMEDIDTERCRSEFLRAAEEDLAWLGITFEKPVRVQSQHMDDYRAALAKLQDINLLYPCNCTRTTLQPRPDELTEPDGTPLYAQTCRTKNLQRGPRTALRLKMDQAIARLTEPLCKNENNGHWLVDPSQWGDVILARKDIGTSYHLSVVVDDALQNITHIVRGKDMQAATSIHRLLQEILGLPHPHYHHHDLITDKAGRKLSKSQHDTSLSDLRNAGQTAKQIRQMLGFA